MGDKGISGHGVECACMPMTSKSENFKKDLSGTVHLCKEDTVTAGDAFCVQEVERQAGRYLLL